MEKVSGMAVRLSGDLALVNELDRRGSVERPCTVFFFFSFFPIASSANVAKSPGAPSWNPQAPDESTHETQTHKVDAFSVDSTQLGKHCMTGQMSIEDA